MAFNVMLKLSVICLMSLAIQSTAYASTDDESPACKDAIDNSHLLNAHELWQGAGECGKANDQYHVTLLLLLGQIRAMTDMGMLKPASDEEEIKIGELYGVLYYQAGGSGYDEIYRDTKTSEKLFSELQNWKPKLKDNYDPGWKYKPNINTKKYNQMIDCQRAIRIDKLNWYSGLVRNDEYYAASKELDELRKKNPGAIKSGSELDKQMSLIRSRMNKATGNASPPTTQPKECEFAQKYEPDPDADFTQLYVGANGPNKSKASAFVSKAEVMNSWIAHSLPSKKLKSVLNQVNFENQILVSLSFGKRQNATGTIHISNVKYNSVLESLSISGLIGVNEKECKEPYADSYPFALAVAPRPVKVPKYPSMSLQNFPDGCKPAMTGSSVTDK